MNNNLLSHKSKKAEQKITQGRFTNIFKTYPRQNSNISSSSNQQYGFFTKRIYNVIERVKVHGPVDPIFLEYLKKLENDEIFKETIDILPLNKENKEIKLVEDKNGNKYYNHEKYFIYIPQDKYNDTMMSEIKKGIDAILDKEKYQELNYQTYLETLEESNFEMKEENIKSELTKLKDGVNALDENDELFNKFINLPKNKFFDKFQYDRLYPEKEISYLEEYTNNLSENNEKIIPFDKPVFLSVRDYKFDKEYDNIPKYNNIPKYMPEYKIFEFILDNINDIDNRDYKLSAYRLSVIGLIKDLDNYMCNPKYYMARMFNTIHDNIENKSPPSIFDWTNNINKLFIQFAIMRRVIFPMMIIGNDLKYREAKHNVNNNLPIIVIKLKEGYDLIFGIDTMYSDFLKSNEYIFINIWGNRIFLTESLGNYARINYYESNWALYTLQRHNINNNILNKFNLGKNILGRKVYVYKIKTENNYLISKYSIDNIKMIYSKLKETLSATLVKFPDKISEINKLFDQLYNEVDLLINVEHYKYNCNIDGKYTTLFRWNILNGITNIDKCEPTKTKFKKKYLKYKQKYLKLKNLIN